MRMKSDDRFEAWPNTNASNLIFAMEKGHGRYCKLVYLMNKQVLLNAFGKQDYCWVGAWGHRNWIWERTFLTSRGFNCRYRLYISTRGFSMDVEQDCQPEDLSEIVDYLISLCPVKEGDKAVEFYDSF